MTREHRPPPPEVPPPAGLPAPGDPSDDSSDDSSDDTSDDTSAGDPSRLAGLIRAEIESSAGRRITFARFMDRALYEPGLGYYRRPADRPTDAGDFLTAPETHAIFGWTVAGRIEAAWDELGRPRPFHLIEHGAGSGTLALAIIDGFRRHGAAGLLESVRYTAVESNPHRLEDLERRFKEAGFDRLLDVASSPPPARGTPGIEAVPVSGVLIANEFLDALPVHRVLGSSGGGLLELFVAWRDGFVEVSAEPSTPDLAARLAEDGVELAAGQVAEICLELDPWLRGVASHLGAGLALIVDYGYEANELYGPRHFAGTLLGYRGHRVVENPLGDPGTVDITAHVDFTAVARLAERHGLETVSLTTQSEFLIAAGLEDELRSLQSSPELTPADYTRARSGIVRMLDPRHMGRFRVLTLRRKVSSG